MHTTQNDSTIFLSCREMWGFPCVFLGFILDYPLVPTLLDTLTSNLEKTVFEAIGHTSERRALLVYDRQSVLASLLTDGYLAVLPQAATLDFSQVTPGDVRGAIDALSPGDLVIMVQSTSFRLNEFRFRLELFNRRLAVMEHPHLGRIPEHEHATYVDSLAYDKDYYRSVGPILKEKIDQAKAAVVSCEGTELVYQGPFESAKLNIGDYTGMKNIGGQFPIGEVFTELSDLANVSGQAKIFAFADEFFKVVVLETPITLVIEQGIIVETKNITPTFQAVLDKISQTEPLTIRELGFGMNRAMTRERILTDIGSYERMCGIHLSIGAKHTIYSKVGFPKRSSRYHVDVFVEVRSVTIDGQTVFAQGGYTVN